MGMESDPLDKEVSVTVSGSMTDGAVSLKASAKSRLLSAADRLLGSVPEYLSALVESKTEIHRAKTKAKINLIEASARVEARKIEGDPSLAAQLSGMEILTTQRRIKNKRLVFDAASSDLRNNPPTEEQSVSGGDKIGDDFLGRFESYAEQAATDELQEKWGKVLAGEIRQPGSFSRKSMRIVDEIDTNVAILFESLCVGRVSNFIIKRCVPDLQFDQLGLLVEGDLIRDPGGAGHIAQLKVFVDRDGKEAFLLTADEFALAIYTQGVDAVVSSGLLERGVWEEGKAPTLNLDVFVLTKSGEIIANLINTKPLDVLTKLAREIRAHAGAEHIKILTRVGGRYAVMPEENIDITK
jgi:hypothetical protein